ncbi:IS1595-like element ISAnmi1 family transposase [Aneurinibacillus migulanus]|uniref:IS1595-like element ISAnmi1 family transposase n=1 Tax=Aneurinibacillus migulanus TaxID=47500 RepID=UPI002E23DF32|nr:IS1595-like element ISAnmi1 family transposase [Aneurinibacillus migulanus]
MSAKGFRNLLQYISSMDKPHQERIYYEIQRKIFPSNATTRVIDELRDKRYSKGFNCAHCKSNSVVRFDKYNGRQRYKCKNCGKTFSDLTNSPLQGTHYPEKWIQFIDCMLKGMSLRESSKELGVHHVTLFYWRHKVLAALEQMQIEQFEGILEVDETYFLFSEKGKKNINDRKPRKRGGVSQFRGISKEQVCVIVGRDRNKNTVSKVACLGRIEKTQVEKTIGRFISNDAILCTDGWRGYKTYAIEKGLVHYRIDTKKTGYVIKGLFHIQNVNNYHGRLKQWLDRFKGVASKYLNHYLAWFHFLETIEFEATKSNLKDMLIFACLFPVDKTYDSLRKSKFMIA